MWLPHGLFRSSSTQRMQMPPSQRPIPTFGVRLVDTDEEPVIFIDDERVNVDSTGHLYEDLQRELTYGLLQRLAPRC